MPEMGKAQKWKSRASEQRDLSMCIQLGEDVRTDSKEMRGVGACKDGLGLLHVFEGCREKVAALGW